MIRAKSKIHKIKRNGREVPVVKNFSDEIWKRLPNITTINGDILPKMGYVKIVSEGEILIDDDSKKPAAPAKNKEEQGDSINIKQVVSDHAEAISAFEAGEEDELNAKEQVQPLAKDLGLNTKQRKSILTTEIKRVLNEAGVL